MADNASVPSAATTPRAPLEGASGEAAASVTTTTTTEPTTTATVANTAAGPHPQGQSASDLTVDLSRIRGRVGKLFVEKGYISVAYKQLKAAHFPKTDITQRGGDGSTLVFPTRADLLTAVGIGKFDIKNGLKHVGQVVEATVF